MGATIEIVFRSFWTWFGTVFLLLIIGLIILRVIELFMRMVTVMIRGWPPSHINASGEWLRRRIDRESKNG